jgi:hypothetical protein
MTVEIKQLIVRAVVETRPNAAIAPPEPAPRVEPANHEAFVAACVREVLRELNRAKER